LALSARLPGTGEGTSAHDSLAVLVPDRPAGATGNAKPAESNAVAVLLPGEGEGSARALQPPGGAARRGPHDVTLDVLQYAPDGSLSLSGRADPNAQVQVYLDDRLAGSATADASGQWSAEIGEAVPHGRYRLRMDALGPNGKVVGRLALPLQRDVPLAGTEGAAYTVQPGNSLWRIARRSYGVGTQYVEIYRANREQIANPDRIFPGQILAVPPRR
jgi:nucleoid-associated protein YgaU